MIAASLRSMTQETALFRVITLNANGIRAAARKGFFEWLKRQDADVICIQETKAQAHQLTDEIFSPEGSRSMSWSEVLP